ncbi:hypothetical protein PVAG01_09863 [Phlyctema vagabunda]|uniref:Carbohydrate-binding module family 18 protein n=1 Tax=Phlyctema vagabunda TaxID=108571 RepID=A0ABR4P4D6_9HELO
MLTTYLVAAGLQLVAGVNALPGRSEIVARQQTVTCTRTFPTIASDTCASLIEIFGITAANFYTWNPQTGEKCENFVPGNIYCIRATVSGTPLPVTSTKASSTTTRSSTTSSAVASPTSNVSVDGSCGGTGGKICTGSTFGNCCSAQGYCGSTIDYCSTGCNPLFGTCTESDISSDGQCGANGKTCTGSSYGTCCSSTGWCGTTDDHCKVGCQAKFGVCEETNITTDGQCGANGKTCTGGTFGTCCSTNGWCGTTDGHCDASAGCQAGFGTCNTGNISTDGQCGANGKTCVGSGFGNCCSKTGWCGSDVNFCAQGCQTKSSSACLTKNIPSLTGECGANNGGFVCAGGPFDGGCCSTSGWCGKGAGFC